MLFALARSIPQAYLLLKAGSGKRANSKAWKLRAKLSVLSDLAASAAKWRGKCQAMGMNVMHMIQFINPDTPLSSGFSLVSLPQIFEQADFISLHVPLTDATRNLVNKNYHCRNERRCPPDQLRARGIIDENDLCDALKSGKIAAPHSMSSTRNPIRIRLSLRWTTSSRHLTWALPQSKRSARFPKTFAGRSQIHLLKNAVSGALNFPQLDLGQVESYQHFVDLAARIATFTCRFPKDD
jgi:D-3-phosphoglycerate dehydrogenase